MNSSNLDRQVANHFDSLATVYANSYTDDSFFAYFLGQRLDIIADSLKDYDRAKILDVGCGPGMMAHHSIAREFEFFGIDISEKMIDECKDKFSRDKSVNFSVGKIQKLDFPDNFFDVVLCMGILEYVPKNEIEGALSEINRVLKPGGQAIISLMNENSLFAWQRRVRNYLSKMIVRKENQAQSYDHLSRPFEEKAILPLLKSSQLKTVNTKYYGLNIYPYFLEHKIRNAWKVKISSLLDKIIGGNFKLLYMAFIVRTIGQDGKIEPVSK